MGPWETMWGTLGCGGLFRLWCSGPLGAIAASPGSRLGRWLYSLERLRTGSVGSFGAKRAWAARGLGGVPGPAPLREVQGLVWGMSLCGRVLLCPGAAWADGLWALPPGHGCPGCLVLWALGVQADWRGGRRLPQPVWAPQPGTSGLPPRPQLLGQEHMQRPLQPWVPHVHQGTRQAQQAHGIFPGLCHSGLQALGPGAPRGCDRGPGTAVGAPKVQGQVAVREAEAVSLEGGLQGLVGQGGGPRGPQEAVQGEAVFIRWAGGAAPSRWQGGCPVGGAPVSRAGPGPWPHHSDGPMQLVGDTLGALHRVGG